MIVTEERAKKMLCAERCYGQMATVTCVGRECMSWRVHDRVTLCNKAGETLTVERGYCGLAGAVKGRWFRRRHEENT